MDDINNILIYENTYSLSNELCRDMIELFEVDKDNGKYQGVTGSGLNLAIKHSTDLVITNYPNWDMIVACLNKELQRNVVEYIKRLDNQINNKVLSDAMFTTKSIQIQKYDKNTGKYISHNDALIKDNQTRVVTFLWYLNDVTEGGETQIWDKYKVKPTAGKLLLFPATWTFPHRGNVPISSDKYIATGWLSSNI